MTTTVKLYILNPCEKLLFKSKESSDFDKAIKKKEGKKSINIVFSNKLQKI